jgi:hypothetical protein
MDGLRRTPTDPPDQPKRKDMARARSLSQNTTPAHRSTPFLKYDGLPSSKSFRLLKFVLEGVLGTALTSPIMCEISTYDLQKPPAFTALSYTWGAPYREIDANSDDLSLPVFSAEILCNGRPFSVTQNLFDALSILRAVCKTDFVWIDGICINQSDRSERAHQVALMGEIYSIAQEVIAWLGPERVGLDDMIWATSTLQTALRKHNERFGPIAYNVSTLINPALQQELGVEDSTRRLMGLVEFYWACRFFNRAWIVQEMVLARALRMFCGSKEISFSHLLELTAALDSMGWAEGLVALLPLEQRFVGEAFLRDVVHWGTLREYHTNEMAQQQQEMPLEEMYQPQTDLERSFGWLLHLLNSNRLAACSDLRDKIYAILGIADVYFDMRISEHVQPDYLISVEKLYTTITKRILNHSRFLDPVSFVEHRQSVAMSSKLPSWVPDYSSINRRYPLMLLCDRLHPFDASSGSGSSTQSLREVSGSILTCLGVQFDRVHDVCPVDMVESLGWYHIWPLLEFCAGLPAVINGCSRLEAMWRTFIVDTAEGTYPAPTTLERSFRAKVASHIGMAMDQKVIEGARESDQLNALKTITERYRDNGSPEFCLIQAESIQIFNRFKDRRALEGPARDAMLQEIADASAIIGPYMRACQRPSQDRRLLTTKTGLLVLGPDSCQAGDQIWLLRDARVPYLLRPVPDNTASFEFQLVGDCYIHGFMHGEMLQGPRSLEGRFQPIRLV